MTPFFCSTVVSYSTTLSNKFGTSLLLHDRLKKIWWINWCKMCLLRLLWIYQLQAHRRKDLYKFISEPQIKNNPLNYFNRNCLELVCFVQMFVLSKMENSKFNQGPRAFPLTLTSFNSTIIFFAIFEFD